MVHNKQGIDMLHGRIWTKVLRFALPVAATGILEQLFNASGIMIVGNFSQSDGTAAVEALQRVQADVGFSGVQFDDQIGKLSLVGAGMRSNPGVSATFFKALAEAGVNIEMISTSEIRISVITRGDLLDDAVRAVHTAFGLDSSEGEAVVYGGTGR